MMDIGKLQTHIRWIERGMMALGVCLLGLAGVTWNGYDKLTGHVSTLALSQQNVSGRIDTLDAKIGGKLDLLAQRMEVGKAVVGPKLTSNPRVTNGEAAE